MFIIRYPYSHQYKRVIVIVYWSEYPDEVISLEDYTINDNEGCHNTDALLAHELNSIFKCIQHSIYEPRSMLKLF